MWRTKAADCLTNDARIAEGRTSNSTSGSAWSKRPRSGAAALMAVVSVVFTDADQGPLYALLSCLPWRIRRKP
jgi:hypothetical protein